MPFTPRVKLILLLSIVLLSAIVAMAAYLQALHYPFIFDDEYYLTGNARLASLSTGELWRLFIEPYNPLEFLPLRDLSYWFDIKLFGMNPAAFRVHNIVLYLLCLPLIYATTLYLWRYFRPTDAKSAHWAAAAVTALFALNPAHVEAVVCISSRKDVLSGLFSLLALWFSVKAKGENGLSVGYCLSTLLALLAAILSKATSVAVAPIIAMLWVLFLSETPASSRRRYSFLWPLANLLLAASVTPIFMKFTTVNEPFNFGGGSIERALAILGWLARLSISPESRHSFYPVFEDVRFSAMMTLGAIIMVAAVIGIVMTFRKRKLAWFALTTFVLLCLPYAQLSPFRTSSLVSDRFLFLAVWPAVILTVALAWRLKPVVRTILFVVIALAWGFQTVERPYDWRSEEARVNSDLTAYPGHYLPAHDKIWYQLRFGQYGNALRTANTIVNPYFRKLMIEMIRAAYAVRFRTASTGKLDEAMAAMQNAELALDPQPAQSKWNPPMRYVRNRAVEVLALKWVRLAELFPDDAVVRYKAGMGKLEARDYKDAVAHLRAATGSADLPQSLRGKAYKSIGLALLESNYPAEAEAPLLVALEQSPPDLEAYCLLASVYRQTGKHDEAVNAEAVCRSNEAKGIASR